MTDALEQSRLDIQRRLLAARIAAAQAKQTQPAQGDHPDVTLADGTVMKYNPATGQMTNADLMANSMQPGVGASALAGAANGATFGWFDEIAGKVSGDPMMTEVARAKEAAARRDHPYVTGGAGIAGGLGVTAPLLAVTGPSSLLGQAATGAGIGAAAGAVQGAGDANDNSRMVGAGTGALIGGALGAAAPFIARGVQ